MHIEAAAVVQNNVFDILVFYQLLRHPISYKSSQGLADQHHEHVLLNSVETEGNKEFNVTYIEHAQTIPKWDERGVENDSNEATVRYRGQHPEKLPKEVDDIWLATGFELGYGENHEHEENCHDNILCIELELLGVKLWIFICNDILKAPGEIHLLMKLSYLASLTSLSIYLIALFDITSAHL